MSKLSHAQKQAATAELNAIAKRNGGKITPDQVVEAARSPKSPLHYYFEWDNPTAAHQWRIAQARTLISSVKINVTIESEKISCVGYVRDPSADTPTQGYIQVAKVRNHDDLSRDVLISEFERVRGTLTRARKLAAVFGMLPEMDSLVDTLDLMTSKIQDTGQRLAA